MDYELKYKNALEWARQVMNGETGFIREEVVYVFPELAESEDERIRKAIKYCIKQGFIGCGKIENVTPDECLAWLEKQGHVKDSDISQHEDKTCKENGNSLTNEYEKMIRRIIEKLQRYMPTDELLEEQEMVAWLENQGEQNSPILSNSSNIGKDLQVDGFDAELNALLKKYEHLPKNELQEPLEFYLGVVSGVFSWCSVRDDLDIVREEKPKWTEEDDYNVHCCIAKVESDIANGYSGRNNEIINWLKSLKQRMED